ncbi:MAG: SdrD B-like domain-containing protein [Bacteroidota bacterium]
MVFEDYDGDALQDSGEPGLSGILVTAVDSTGSTVGQTSTNNLGAFEFGSLIDGRDYRLEFTTIPSGMYPTSGATHKGTTVQFVESPSCATTLGLINPTENDCAAPNSGILRNGYALVAALPDGNDVTLSVRNITQLGTLWQTPANRNNNQSANVPITRSWRTTDFEGASIFSTAIDPKDGTIYAVATPFYEDGGGVILDEFVPAKVFKIDPNTGNVTRITQLGGTLGLGYIDFDVINEQLLISNIDDGKIYRLNTDGVTLGSFDPLTADNGTISQLPPLGDRIIGVAFNPIDKRVYYSTWNNHPVFTGTYANLNNDANTIRSVGLDENGAFETATDRLEIALPNNLSTTNGNNLTNPVADIAFNRQGDRMLLSAISLSANNSTGAISIAANNSVVREYYRATNIWTIEPTFGGNNEGKYDIGTQTFYRGRNSRGGVAWAYQSISGDTLVGNDDYIIATGDDLHINSIEGDFISGYQFTPATGGNITNSILVDLDNNVASAQRYTYGDVDIYKDYCANLTLEIGDYVWLDSDQDGVQDASEVGLSGIRVSLFDAMGDSLTTVTTNSEGAYYFSESTSGFSGLTPNTDYYIVVGKGGQYNPSNNSLFFVFNLSDANSGEGDSPDLNDSDAIVGAANQGHPVSVRGYPVIAIRTGEMGHNNHSLDFGFKEICTPATAVNDSLALCPGIDYEGSVAINDSNIEDKTFSVLVQPSDGSVVMNDDGVFKYTSTTSDCDNDQFVYQVCDATRICCSNATVYLDFNDTEKPVLQNIPADDTVSCDEFIPLPPQIFASDNCPRITVDVTEESTQGEDGCSLYDYTITRTWTAFDQCGNTSSGSQTIEVKDIVAPDIFRIYNLPNGKKMVAGVMEFVGENWKIVNLPIDFDTKPIIFHQVVTANDATPVISQIQNTSVSQFELRLMEEEGQANDHKRESVAWIAIEAGTQLTDYQLEANTQLVSSVGENINFQNNFPALPALITSSQSTDENDPFMVRNSGLTVAGMDVSLQEETSNDTETVHTDEVVGYLAIENTDELRDGRGILIGEVGTSMLNSNWTTINLNNAYHNPVIVANSLSSSDGAPATVRVRNVGLNNFQIRVEEWDYLDGIHGNETVSYMVVEGSIPLESPNYCDTGTDNLDISIDFKAVDNCDVGIVINYTEKDTFIGPIKVIHRTWSAEDECGNATSYTQEITCDGVSLQLKSMLQGAMIENNGDGLMRDNLRKLGLIPHQEPYTGMWRFTHVASGGGEVMDTTLLEISGRDAIVDWVFVELRDASDINNVLATKSALIQCDGDVIDVKGDSILIFPNAKVGDYYVSVRHRNHLGLVTLSTRTFSPSNAPFVDFTYDFTPVVGTNSSVEMDNLEALWSGDLNSDGKVIYQGPNNDIFYIFLHVLQDANNKDFLPNFISTGYTNDDFNLDGSVIYQGPNNDRARLLFSTILSHPDNPQKFSNFIIYEGSGN